MSDGDPTSASEPRYRIGEVVLYIGQKVYITGGPHGDWEGRAYFAARFSDGLGVVDLTDLFRAPEHALRPLPRD